MSRRPGIGSSWLAKYASDVYTTGKVLTTGYAISPPRYYDKLYKKIDQLQLEQIQFNRELEALAHIQDHTPERLAVQEQVSIAKTKQLKRTLQL